MCLKILKKFSWLFIYYATMIFVGVDQVILVLIYTNQIRPYVCNREKELCGPKFCCLLFYGSGVFCSLGFDA